MGRTLPHRLMVPLLTIVVLLDAGVPLKHISRVAANGRASWASPGAMAVKRVSNISKERHEPVLFNNLDCVSLTYRLVGTSEMRTGCFTRTAFGELDSDSETVIFNGTDEAVPLLAHSPHEVLAPWTNALNMLTLDAADTGGSYLGMYTNPLPLMRDQTNWKGQITAKQLTGPPDTAIKSATGQPLVINPQTLAGSGNGSWLVVETLNGSFVRINLASLDQLPFAKAFGSQGSPALLKSQVALSDDGRYATIENDSAKSFKVYDLSTCGTDTGNWQANHCQAYDYWPFVSQQIKSLSRIRHVRFVNDGLLSFEALDADDSISGVYELAPTDHITYLIGYLGLGDSYTSGEGAFDYLTGTDTSDNTCHLSARSYPLLLTRDLFGGSGGHSVACSGAVIDDVGSTNGSYKGQVRHGSSLLDLESRQSDRMDTLLSDYLPGYMPQRLFVKHYQPGVITVSIGGNDIGFGDILQRCVVPHISRHISDETCYNTYESRQELVNLVNRTVPRWTSLYKRLLTDSPGSSIYAVGYPSIASDTGKCPLNVGLGKGELEFAEELIHYLNGAIKQAATAAGVPYVDISQALKGYRLCEGGTATAVNGLTAGNDFGVLGMGLLGRESYHPNALGHELIEQTILKQTDRFSSAITAETGTDSSPNLLTAPKTGRTVNDFVPDDNLLDRGLIYAGGRVPIHVNGLRDGLRPGNQYEIRLDGAEGRVLANLTSDSDGNLSGAVTVPDQVTDGGHTIDVTGDNQAGHPVDISQPVYVPSDTCSYAPDSDPNDCSLAIMPVFGSADDGSGNLSGPINPKPSAGRHAQTVGKPPHAAKTRSDGRSDSQESLGVRDARFKSPGRMRASARMPERHPAVLAYGVWLAVGGLIVLALLALRKIIKRRP